MKRLSAIEPGNTGEITCSLNSTRRSRPAKRRLPPAQARGRAPEIGGVAVIYYPPVPLFSEDTDLWLERLTLCNVGAYSKTIRSVLPVPPRESPDLA